MIHRIYTERRPDFRQENQAILYDFKSHLGTDMPADLRIIRRYDVEGLELEDFKRTIPMVFADPVKDSWTLDWEQLGVTDKQTVIAVEALPGQFDQRADSAMQCIQFVLGREEPQVRTATIYVFSETLADDIKAAIIEELVNPVENRLAKLEPVNRAKEISLKPEHVKILDGFREMKEGAGVWLDRLGLAMDQADLKMVRDYFKEEGRDPSITEIRMIDTYWSDHCRHTTFNTQLTDINIEDPLAQESFDLYLQGRKDLGRTKPISLMDLGTLAAKELKAQGLLTQLDESEEINACTVKVKVEVEENGEEEDWLLLFKNETHNHPTEIEPFGGAATCLGGAIRDPLSGRGYVYQAMRVTGAADPYTTPEETPEGKLPQRRIMQQAAQGYSSYGNQVGVPSGLVDEIYHPGCLAKRLECGAVVAAVPADQVVRKTPQDGDLVILIGGRTGRDGLGGATGSSKSHTTESVETSAAEVQKGNPPQERSIMRLFRKPEVSSKIKRCNDFGAGGVAVAIGELADGLKINLDLVPKKYSGLDGTEIAISESQERMALVIDPADEDFFQARAEEENVECTVVARVTADPRVVMEWQGQTLVDLSRAFLDSNGAPKFQSVEVREARTIRFPHSWDGSLEKTLENLVQDLNVASKAGLIERFDGTVGSRSVLLALGGKTSRTPVQAMAARLPRLGKPTDATSVMSYAYNPYLSEQDEYAGAYLAVLESVARLIATGGRKEETWLSFQEYFQSLRDNPQTWGSPMASLLGAYQAQKDLSLASIGGKDSMSGTFEDLHVPPTLISFAISLTNGAKVVSPEVKEAGTYLVQLDLARNDRYLPSKEDVLKTLALAQAWIQSGQVLSASTASYGGPLEQIFKALVGNRMGFEFDEDLAKNPEALENLLDWHYGSFIFEVREEQFETYAAEAEKEGLIFRILGKTLAEPVICCGDEKIALSKLQAKWEGVLEDVYPTQLSQGVEVGQIKDAWRPEAEQNKTSTEKDYTAVSVLPKGLARPKIVIPVFPGTNTEEETARAFREAGGDAEILIIKNLTLDALNQGLRETEKALKEAQILFLPGGFSGGDEPDGSGKFINAYFRNENLQAAIMELLRERDGLVGGICNGFQALVKLGLLPYGEIRLLDETAPTLDQNLIGRHQAMLVTTKVQTNRSPWLSQYEIGETHQVAISHGEGQFRGPEELIDRLFKNGQVATQYVDENGQASMDICYNPNSSMAAIEGLISEDGRVFGRMGHSERMVPGTLKNSGNPFQKSNVFAGAVRYFTEM